MTLPLQQTHSLLQEGRCVTETNQIIRYKKEKKQKIKIKMESEIGKHKPGRLLCKGW